MKLRKIAKKLTLIALILTLPVTTTGCWDRLEINDVALVVAMGIDLEKDGQYRFSAQIPLPGQMGGAKGGGGGTGGTKSSYIDSDTGSTLREAAVKMQKRMSRRMIYGHYRVLVIGEDAARNGIGDMLDIVSRWPENRMTAYLVVAKGRALDLLNIQPKLERFSAEAMRELIKVGGFMPFTIKNIAQATGHVGADPIIPYLGKTKVQDQAKEPNEIEVFGYAQFRGNKMVDVFEGDASNGITWLRKRAKPTFVSVKAKNDKMMFHLNRGKTNIVPTVDANDHVTFDVHISAKLVLVENLSSANIVNEKSFAEITADLKESIKQQVEKAVEIIQKNETDSGNFGYAVYRKYPRRWEQKYKSKWPEMMRTATFRVHVDAEIARNGLTFEKLVK